MAGQRQYGPSHQADCFHGRHVSGLTAGLIVDFVRCRLGDSGVTDVLLRAGESRTPEEMSDPTGWSSYDQVVILFEVVAELFAMPDIGRVIGAEMLRQHRGSPVRPFFDRWALRASSSGTSARPAPSSVRYARWRRSMYPTTRLCSRAGTTRGSFRIR